MRDLKALVSIPVPTPQAERTYALSRFGQSFSFHGLKHLLGAADYSKAGERGAGLAAASELEREAARSLLAQLTLGHLYDNPLTDASGRIDEVMRVNYDIDLGAFGKIRDWKIAELKDWLLRAPPAEVNGIGKALTGVMAAAVAKLMDVHELIYVARKFSRPTKARTRIGLPQMLSSRCQPNHPIDDLRGVTLLVYLSFCLGGGDALVGINPAIDTVENISKLLHHLDKIRRAAGAPTQICVLAHVKTQMACLERGAPVEVMFQSLAGTEATNLSEFDICVGVLDDAYRMMATRGPLKGEAEQFMYFETGQGSEYSYGKHDGIDMATAEALTYGLARRYDPFMVNNVTGFIGPETHRDNDEMILSSLQDHFMGKLLGLPMGMAPCYTLHAEITLEGQQIATELLASAGANYYMDVALNTDRMLAYFDTSAHDDQTLREIHGRRQSREFTEWAMSRGILRLDADGILTRGENWGNPGIFCSSKGELDDLLHATPAMYGFASAGPRPSEEVSRETRINRAYARKAAASELDPAALGPLGDFTLIRTGAADKQSYWSSPGAGAILAPDVTLKLDAMDVQIVISDGLSAEAVHAGIPTLMPVLQDAFAAQGVRCGETVVAPYGRVKLAEQIAARTKAPLTIMFVGERPGGDAAAARSMSAYFVFQLLEPESRAAAATFSRNAEIRFEYTVISNIYADGGLPPIEAASVVAEKAMAILKHRAAGNRLEALLS